MRIGEIFILFDCGVTERLKDEDEYDADSGLKRVAEAAGKAHYIFISHPTLHHVGALPFLHKIGVMSNPELKEIFATSPVAKIGAQTMYEFAIQKKELGVFDLFSLKNVESAFEKFQLVPFGENKRIKLGNTELIVSALPSGNGIGGTAWKIEFQKQTLIYALELNDKPTQITPPFPVDRFKHANYFFTNAYLHDKQQHLRSNTNLQFVTEERLKAKVEAALLDK
jgi:cleavage and polyadenylation specificity factor subunit 2